MTLNLATAWEVVADTVGDDDGAICGEVVRSWAEVDERAARIAALLRSAGVGHADNVGLCLYNGNEYVEAQFAIMKERAFPFNVNYRYTAHELRELLVDADATAVFYAAELRDRFAEIHDQLSDVRLFVQVGDEDDVPDFAVGYEAAAAAHDPASRLERSPEDQWILFTGGTTGKPKGVMWPHGEMIGTMWSTYGGMRMELPTTYAEVAARLHDIREKNFTTRQLAAAPLMHGTSGIPALATLTQGGAMLSLTARKFDADELWQCVQERRATMVTIVGDAFSRPMIAALEQAREAGRPYDLSSIFIIMSSGVMWSAPVKAALLEFNPKMRLLDTLGSSEGTGFARKLEGDAAKTSTAKFELGPFTKVFTEDGREVRPGSGERGRLALGGPLPSGYYNDPVKSEETWPTIAGKRYSIPGDWATVESDGSIVLLGRGSVSINTGGEKVYPEEVEEVLKLVNGVVDVNVVGVPDERWGQAITAVIELEPGADITDAAITDASREHLAAYKLPKSYVRVPSVRRAPNGKPDYQWALQTAKDALGIT